MKPSTRTNLKAGAAGPDRRRTRGKGRRVEREAQAAVRAAISNLPKRKDLLVEYLHCLQDRYGHLSAAQLVALADEFLPAKSSRLC